MKIAIIRLSALGDIIVSASILSYISKFLNCKIDWYVDERFVEILKDSHLVSVYALPLKSMLRKYDFKGLWNLYCKLHQLEYDYIIDMQGLLKSALVSKMFKHGKIVGFSWDSVREKIASLFYDKKIYIPYKCSILERNFKILCETFNLPLKNMPLDLQGRKNIFSYSIEARNFAKSIKFMQVKNILLLLEASVRTKSYHAQNLIQLIDYLKKDNFGILLLYYDDLPKAQEIYHAHCDYSYIKILPKINLDYIKALVAEVDLVIGGDTGITHLAWAMENASITLYGNTPMERFKLLGKNNISLSGNTHATYDKNDFSINKITPQEIYKNVKELL